MLSGICNDAMHCHCITQVWFIVPVAIVSTLIVTLLLVIPLVQSPGPALINLSVTVSSIPVFFIFVMERPYKIRPKFLDRLSGRSIQLCGRRHLAIIDRELLVKTVTL